MVTLYGVKAKRLIDELDIPYGEGVWRTVKCTRGSVEGRTKLVIEFKEEPGKVFEVYD